MCSSMQTLGNNDTMIRSATKDRLSPYETLHALMRQTGSP